MIEGFQVKDQALGTGDNAVYTFDFKIFDKADLLIFVQDANGNILEEIRGDDTTYISSVVFDSINGGGTVTLINDLDDEFVMTTFLAPDYPDQPTSFPNKASFSLSAIEGALDYLATLIQRIAWLAQRSVRMHELDDIDNFDPTLPISIGSYPGGVVSVKADGSGFEVATTVDEVAAAQGNAAAALASAGASAASAAAALASANAAAASALAAQSGFYVIPTTNRLNPTLINPAVSIAPNNSGRQMMFLSSNGGAQNMSAVPQISPGVSVGQELVLVGCSDINTLKIFNGTGFDLNGDMVIASGDTIGLAWDGSKWSELYRRSAT